MKTTMDLQITACSVCGSNYAGSRCPRCGRNLEDLEMAAAALRSHGAPQPLCRMNKTETRYACLLHGLVATAQISDYRFETVKFRLADSTQYTPDFMVVYPGGSIEFHEVKGPRIWDDAVVKFKFAAEALPMFGWRLVQWKGGEWRTLRGYVNGCPK